MSDELASVDDELAERIARALELASTQPRVDAIRAVAEAFMDGHANLMTAIEHLAVVDMPSWARFEANVKASQREAGRHKPGRGRRAPANKRKRQAATVVRGL